MGIWLVLGLGALQGLTEFLPVSSSGHLRLLAAWFGVEDPQTLFDILMHVGTLLAVFVVYRKLFGKMLNALWRLIRAPSTWPSEPYARVAVFAAIATVPTGIIAIAAGDAMESLSAAPWVVGVALLVNGCILLFLGRLSSRSSATSDGRSLEELKLSDALLVGTVQGLGIFRGISRSGSTITAGLVTGLRQDAAAAFSFVLSVPAILGALVLKFDSSAVASADQAWLYLAGAVTSGVVGTAALIAVLRLLRGGRLHVFAWYCFAVGAIAIAFDLTH